MISYSITYTTFNAGSVSETTMLITATKFYYEGDNILFLDDQNEPVFVVPTSRQPVIKVITS